MKNFFNRLLKAEAEKARRKLYVIFAAICAAMTVVLLFVPLLLYPVQTTVDGVTTKTILTLTPIKAFFLPENVDSSVTGIPALSIVAFVLVAVFILVTAAFTAICIKRFFSDSEIRLAKSARILALTSTVTTALYFFISLIVIMISRGGGADLHFSISFLPFVIMLALDVFIALFTGAVRKAEIEKDQPVKIKNKEKDAAPTFSTKIELFIYASVLVILAVIAILTNILTVEYSSSGSFSYEAIEITGIDFFRNYATLSLGGQIICFVLFALLTAIATTFFLCLVSFLSKSRLFAKLSLVTVIVATVCCLLVGMFGKYYEVIQKLNDETLQSLLNGILGTTLTYEYTAKSNSFYLFVISIIVVAVMIFRRPYSKVVSMDQLPVTIETTSEGKQTIEGEIAVTDVPEEMLGAGVPSADNTLSAKPRNFDPCPAFTELDSKIPEFNENFARQKLSLFEEPTLPKLVQFVVNYARDSRLHLSYTQEDIATFIAGLGTTKLTILQGMSGTGKTSLPKIFAEALSSRCEIIEVESSWRDKNELLGYYNEFSKTYTPKKFTQALYRAKLNPETLHFIVLDEMNLSRIEYYFSDFLSLMENEPDKRELKLLNVGLYRTEKGEPFAYKGLTDGHTLKIPPNVWFVGTANRDESTFEISDKVYDRAHTMNFNKRAPKVTFYNDPVPQKFLPVDMLDKLFADAKSTFKFNIDSFPSVASAEKLLAPYNISFGNRIAMQIESFVSIYCSCFTVNDSVIRTAVESILLSKVVSKLELKSVENKERLAAEFAKLGFNKCSDFILKLNED